MLIQFKKEIWCGAPTPYYSAFGCIGRKSYEFVCAFNLNRTLVPTSVNGITTSLIPGFFCGVDAVDTNDPFFYTTTTMNTRYDNIPIQQLTGLQFGFIEAYYHCNDANNGGMYALKSIR
jgi:hypothetical protein